MKLVDPVELVHGVPPFGRGASSYYHFLLCEALSALIADRLPANFYFANRSSNATIQCVTRTCAPAAR